MSMSASLIIEVCFEISHGRDIKISIFIYMSADIKNDVAWDYMLLSSVRQ